MFAASEGKVRRKRGRRSADNSKRDQIITWVTFVIAVRYKLRATRNPGSIGINESACSIVAAALKEVGGVRMGERNVESIWGCGSGPDLLIQERALTDALGPNLWILTAPMVRGGHAHFATKLATGMVWGPLTLFTTVRAA